MSKLTPAILSSIVPQDIRTVQTLDLKKRDFEEIEDLSVCVELQKLDLKGNKLSSIEGLIYNKDLTWLSLSENNIKNISNISRLKKLNVLNLSHNKIKITEGIEQLTNLQALILNNNKLINCNSFANLKQLNTLVLSDNRIEDCESIKGLTNLRKLSLGRNKIASLPSVNLFAGWGLKLTEVRLSHNLLTSVPQCFENAPLLKILDLGNNQIFSFDGLKILSTLPSLVNLTLKKNPISSDENYKTRVREICPSLVIFDDSRLEVDFRKLKRKKLFERKMKRMAAQGDDNESGDSDNKEKNEKNQKRKFNDQINDQPKKKVKQQKPEKIALHGREHKGTRISFDSDDE